ncbi:MAG: tRNA uridine-5-carboxymethylaminomethyl(34) synthesis GTPase MnmE [Gemmatimonadaceae bacterium]
MLVLPGVDDTIAAIATAAGRGAIAVLRMSGSAAKAIASRVLSPWEPEPGRSYLATLRDPSNDTIVDRGIVTVYEAPRSYTGEDVVELSVHGGAVVPVLALSALIAAGARQALPGEFTRRAVANGKLDLVQAEAVADLVDARSRSTHKLALSQLDGSLSYRINVLREAILQLEVLIAYDIDFPDEDDGPVALERVRQAVKDLTGALDALLETARTGQLVREGALVVIAGPPNAGKSSLFNAILGSARAIVTEIPGTTRDAIEAAVDLGGWPVRLVDTAGIRESADVVERLGIEVSERYLAGADLVLACAETSASLESTVQRVHACSEAPVLPVLTKADLLADRYHLEPLVADSYLTTDSALGPSNNSLVATSIEVGSLDGPPALDNLMVSAVTGRGLGELERAVWRLLAGSYGDLESDVPLLTRERHRLAVEEARQEVAAFSAAWAGGELPAPVAAVHLRAASHALEEVVGAIGAEDVLDRVFRSFCVGK